MKRLIKVSMLLMMVTLLAACNNEEITQQDKEKKIDAPKGGVVFATNDTKISAKRWFIDDKAFTDAKTRTDIKHIPGNGADAYWTSDDFIWVKKQDGTWAQSTSTTLHDGGASAEFTLPGNKSDYADGCEVRYTGTSRTKFGAFNVPGGVGIHAYQNRTTPNDFSNAGEWGDCGSGKAYNTGNPAKFNFTLAHKASYLCFLPRCENTTLAPNIRLKGIKITATNEMRFADLCMFDGEELTAPGSPFGWDFINVDLPDFKIDTKANLALNAVYMVVRPGTYNFKIEYTIEDPTTNVVGTITDVRTGITLAKDNFYDVTANLTPPVLTQPKYYMWDAQQDYWHEFENDRPTRYLGEAGATQGQNYPQNSADPKQRWCNENNAGYGMRYDAQTGLFNTLPNANELYWYVMKGDPHWDDQAGGVYARDGHLWVLGGIWLRKKNVIINYLINTEHYPSTLTWNEMKEGYWGTPTALHTDYRSAGGISTVSPAQGRPSNLEDYFFLPAWGFYNSGWWNALGGNGDYWSSSADPKNSTYAYRLFFYKSGVTVGCDSRSLGFPVKAFE